MAGEIVRIAVEHAALDAVSGRWHAPAGGHAPTGPPRSSAILLAHGAGADMEHPLLAALAELLAERGLPTLRFRYPYMELAQRSGKRRLPDPMSALEAAHAAALEELTRRSDGRRGILCGKSMGGRVGSHLAAKGAACAGLVLLGYPLHPPRMPERTRSEHFAAIAQPALFVQGTRDPHCDLELLAQALRKFGGRATLVRVEGGDHDFARAGADGRDPVRAARELAGYIDAWERAEFPE